LFLFSIFIIAYEKQNSIAKIYFLYKSIEKATGATPGKGFFKNPQEVTRDSFICPYYI